MTRDQMREQKIKHDAERLVRVQHRKKDGVQIDLVPTTQRKVSAIRVAGKTSSFITLHE